MKSGASALLLLGGCAQLAGIDDTSGEGRVGVSLSIERVSIGTSVIRTPQDLSASTATYFATDPDDPATILDVQAVETEPGLWTAEIFNQTPPVLFDLPADAGPPFDRLLVLPNRDLLAAFDVLEHPNRVESDGNAMLSVNATLDAPYMTGTFELFIVGTWASIGLPAPAALAVALAPPPFAVSTMAVATGRPIDQITVDDAPLILRRQGNQLDALLEVTPFPQTGNDPLTGLIAPVALDRTLSIAVDPVAATTRFSAVRPMNAAAPTFGWDLRAAPGHEIGSNTGPLLHGAGVVMETAVTATYANPFDARGWKTVLAWNGSGSRTTTPPGQMLPVTLNSGMSQLVVDPPAGLALDFPAGLPEQISINGLSLSTDGVDFSAPVGPVEITAIVDRSGATLHTLEVRELVPDAGGTALVPLRTLFVAALEPRFTLRPEVFEVGKYYSLRVQSIEGLFPNIADGDVRTRELPVASAFLDSGVFLVVP